jgi:hypothetical protein
VSGQLLQVNETVQVFDALLSLPGQLRWRDRLGRTIALCTTSPSYILRRKAPSVIDSAAGFEVQFLRNNTRHSVACSENCRRRGG